MTAFDGLYRHRGSTLTWNTDGLVLLRPGAPAVRVAWQHVHGAQQDDPQGPVEILVNHRTGVSPRAPRVLHVEVNSTEDAHRLVTTMNWNATEPIADQARKGGRMARGGYR